MRLQNIIMGCMLFGLAGISACSKEGMSTVETTGKGGSLARFTIAGNNLYLIDDQFLNTYSLSNPSKPVKTSSVSVGFDIETVYSYKSFLFIGGRNGFYIYNIANPNKPEKLGLASHARSCDPVVANDSIAFVTLKGTGACGVATSGLYVYDIKSVTSPKHKKTLEFNNPGGLGLQDSVLYVCCGTDGLRIFDVKNPVNPTLVTIIKDGNYMDVIPYNGILICYAFNKMILYDISDPRVPKLIKSIS